ncbi:MAG: nucleotidyltransferase domain-containing protein [Prevotellaceae bacterium]|nr:nucleotidyltransferase domain-containing protein [Candidatus Minthosoma equi]
MSKIEILNSLRNLSRQIMPDGAKVYLYGSQARGDSNEDSDWDILILLDKENVDSNDKDKYGYPFFELGWEINAEIHPSVYSLRKWNSHDVSAEFVENVERDKIAI